MRRPFYSNQKFPFRRIISTCSRRPFLYFLCVEVLICGLWLEDVYQNQFFSRSGAVIAIVALFTLWLWLRYNEGLDSTSGAIESTEKYAKNIGPDFAKIFQTVKRNNSKLPDKALLQISAHLYAIKKDGPTLKAQLTEVTKRLGYAQIEAAGLGTIVWAFGDLILLAFRS